MRIKSISCIVVMICVGALVGCGAGAPVSQSPTTAPTRTLTVDYETFSSVSQLTERSALVIRGHVTTRTVDLTAESTNDSQQKIPSIGREVIIDTVYKGTPARSVWVIKPDPKRVAVSEISQLVPNEDVILFLTKSYLVKDGIGVHDTMGADEGYITLAGKSGKLHPTKHLDSVPLPTTVEELEAQIRSAA